MILNDYIPIIKFMGNFIGTEAELILYDAVEEKVEYIHNSFSADIKKGSPIDEVVKRMISERVYEKEEAVMDYGFFTVDRKQLRSASYFIKNENDKLIGVISINYKVDELIHLRDILNRLIDGSATQDGEAVDYYDEHANFSFKNMMYIKIQETLAKYDVPPKRLSQEEKIELIRSLDEQGVFLVKGSVAELSKTLEASEASVYRYINKI